MIATMRKWLVVIILMSTSGFLLYQWVQYQEQKNLLPQGTVIANVPVSDLTIDEAKKKVQDTYSRPVYIFHMDEAIELDPASVGFILDTDYMFGLLEQELASTNKWLDFASFVTERPLEPINISLSATHDRAGLEAMLHSISDLLDQSPETLQILEQGQSMEEALPGYATDVESSLPLVESSLYQVQNRTVNLVIDVSEPPGMSIDFLRDSIEAKLQGFDGIGSVFIVDLQTGEEIGINSEMAMSGLSILKIGIFVEAFRALDNPPNEYVEQLFLDTATRSSNYGANLLLHVVAGEDNTYLGADIFTNSMQELGLVNTFMAVPYDATPPAYRQTTYVTPANSQAELATLPDTTMQTTAEDIGSLLAMIYYCSKGGGALLAVYPDEITPAECQSIIDLMVQNEEGNLIRYGVPDGTIVSHKHGWARATHADAGIVFSEGGDFVIVEYLNQPGDWLLADVSFPILRDIARASYNYFNMDNPYLLDAFAERADFDPNDPFSENAAGLIDADPAGDGQTDDDAEIDSTGDGETSGVVR